MRSLQLFFLFIYLALIGSSEQATDQYQHIPRNCILTEGGRKLHCNVNSLLDCNQLLNTPYARNLLCPSSYGAAQRTLNQLLTLLGPKATIIDGSFRYYQTLPDVNTTDESQTIEHCLKTTTPWTPSEKLGAGEPLCNLIASTISFDRRPLEQRQRYSKLDKLNPVANTRKYSDYFSRLVFNPIKSDIMNFYANSSWDSMINDLGTHAAVQFHELVPDFNSTSVVYNPSYNYQLPTQYRGMSGGGGSGWGTEIRIEDRGTLLQFGGGGGGGMTSLKNHPYANRFGAGGGGGVNFADGYISSRDNTSLDGLGVGAGSDYETGKVVYSLYAAGNKGRGQTTYNKTILEQFIREMNSFHDTLRMECAAGKEIYLQGGGGGGAGAEYLHSNGQAYTPHALSTQGGFSYQYTIKCIDKNNRIAVRNRAKATSPPLSTLYKELGKIHNDGNTYGKEKCGGWSDYGCVCRVSEKYVLRYIMKKYKSVPEYMKESRCPPSPKKASSITSHHPSPLPPRPVAAPSEAPLNALPDE